MVSRIVPLSLSCEQASPIVPLRRRLRRRGRGSANVVACEPYAGTARLRLMQSLVHIHPISPSSRVSLEVRALNSLLLSALVFRGCKSQLIDSSRTNVYPALGHRGVFWACSRNSVGNWRVE
jgi:hypothetical protein